MKKGNILGASFLISGTCIGAGMLSLPVSTGMAGFYPSAIIYGLSWLVMLITSLLFLEVNLWMKEGANILSMAGRTIGKWGKLIASLGYLFLFYSVCIAYLSACGTIVLDVAERLFDFHGSKTTGILLSLALFAPSMYFGTRVVAFVNMLFMFGLVAGYLLLVGNSLPHIQLELLSHTHWPLSLAGIPVIITSFTSQNVIPSLTTYLHQNVKKLIISIVIGGLIPLAFYLVWQWIVLGIVPPEGPISLQAAYENGEPAIQPLKAIINTPWLSYFGSLFAFCAIATSYLGVILTLFDFLADGLKIRKRAGGKVILCFLVFTPPALFALKNAQIFHIAIRYAGLACILLFILMPGLMTWIGRYHKGFSQELSNGFRVPGGKVLLALIILIGFSLLALSFALQFDWI